MNGESDFFLVFWWPDITLRVDRVSVKNQQWKPSDWTHLRGRLSCLLIIFVRTVTVRLTGQQTPLLRLLHTARLGHFCFTFVALLFLSGSKDIRGSAKRTRGTWNPVSFEVQQGRSGIKLDIWVQSQVQCQRVDYKVVRSVAELDLLLLQVHWHREQANKQQCDCGLAWLGLGHGWS